MMKSKPRFTIRSRRIHFPTIRLPLIGGVAFPLAFSVSLPAVQGLNLGGKTRSIVAFAVIVSALVIAGAIYFAIQGLAAAPVWPDAAVYDAARSQRLNHESIGVGQEPPESQRGTMTLQLNIGGARIESIRFSDMSIGKASGLTDAINISASSGNIQCETLLLEDVEATDLTVATSTAYALTIATTTADGLSISPTLSSDPVKYAFGSTRGALNVPDVKGGTFDRIVILANATSTVGTIEFKRVKAYGAGITLKDLQCGSIIIRGTDPEESIYGDGTGIDTPSFTIANTVKVQSATLTDNIERPVSVR